MSEVNETKTETETEAEIQPIEHVFFVAGVKHHQLDDVINELSEGDCLDLVPEPDNKYDANAIKIIYNNNMLGYVPAAVAKKLAPVDELFDNFDVFCIITALEPDNAPWNRLQVRLSAEQ